MHVWRRGLDDPADEAGGRGEGWQEGWRGGRGAFTFHMLLSELFIA